MATREELHALIDSMPEEAIDAARRLLSHFQVWPPTLPPQVEELRQSMEQRLKEATAKASSESDFCKHIVSVAMRYSHLRFGITRLRHPSTRENIREHVSCEALMWMQTVSRSKCMAEGVKTTWRIKGDEVVSCNCAWGCPCQFNALPTTGRCQGLGAVRILDGHFGNTSLGGVKFAILLSWPG